MLRDKQHVAQVRIIQNKALRISVLDTEHPSIHSDGFKVSKAIKLTINFFIEIEILIQSSGRTK